MCVCICVCGLWIIDRYYDWFTFHLGAKKQRSQWSITIFTEIIFIFTSDMFILQHKHLPPPTHTHTHTHTHTQRRETYMTFETVIAIFTANAIYIHRGRNCSSSAGRLLDLWLKGHRFESWQKQQKKFLVQSEPSVLTYSVSIALLCYCSGKYIHSAKSAGGRLHPDMYTPFTQPVGWLCCQSTVWELSSHPTYPGTLIHSCLDMLSHCRLTWPKEWNWCAPADLH